MKKVFNVILIMYFVAAFGSATFANNLETYDWGKISAELNKYMPTDGLSASPFTRINVNEKEINLDIPPIIVNGNMLIPLRKVSEILGFKVSWEKPDKIIVVKGKDEIKLDMGKKEAVISNVYETKRMSLAVPPFAVDGFTLVPLRFISENMGASVYIDRKINTVFINTTNRAYSNQKTD